MSLLKELSGLNEGQMKNAIMDLIEKAISAADTDGMTYDQAVKAICAKAQAIDHNNIVAGMDDEELGDMVKGLFDESELNEAADPADDNWPKLISEAGGFRVEMDEHEQVTIFGRKGGVPAPIAKMPKTIWNQLSRA